MRKAKKLITAVAFAFVLASVPAFSTTLNFNSYGASVFPGSGDAECTDQSSIAFPGLTLINPSQLDQPGYYGAVNYEFVAGCSGHFAPMTIDFDSGQSAFGLALRDFSGYGGNMTLTVYATNDTTVLDTYNVTFPTNGSIVNFFDSGESAQIGAVSLGAVGLDSWSGILNSVTYNTTTIPEPGTLVLLGTGLIGLAGSRKRKLRK